MEILNNIQKLVLRNFAGAGDSGQFYLTGGTALAHFYLHHRRSEDLDFFTAIPDVILPFSLNLEKHLKSLGLSVQRRRGLDSFVELLAAKGDDSTLIHLAHDAAFRFDPAGQFPEYPQVKVDDLVDIASNKLLALFGRAALRDFIDVYFLVNQAGFSTDRLMELAQKKDPGFDLYWFGIALERIRRFDQKSVDMLLLVKPIQFEQISSFFDRWGEHISEQIKK